MAQIGSFDATQVDPATRPPALPTGWYNVMITDSEMRQTKAGTGHYLRLGMKVQDGPHAGQMVFDQLNLFNPNPVAVEIAQRTLSAICHAVGVMQVQDSQQLHGKPLQARVVKTPADGQYDEGNDVKGYAKSGTHQTNAAPAGAPGNAPTPPAPTPNAPPAPPANNPPAAPPAPPQAPPAAPATPPATPPAPTPPANNPPAQQQGEQEQTANAGAGDMTPPWLR